MNRRIVTIGSRSAGPAAIVLDAAFLRTAARRPHVTDEVTQARIIRPRVQP